MMKLNLSTLLITLCTTGLLTLSACVAPKNKALDNEYLQTIKNDKIVKDNYPTSIMGDLIADDKKSTHLCSKFTHQQLKECTKQGGKLEKQGMAQCYLCTIEYADAGKTCSDSSECDGACLNYGDFIPAGKTNQKGQCSKDNSPFGCYQKIEKGMAKHAMCVD